jgi:hypothetical protein
MVLPSARKADAGNDIVSFRVNPLGVGPGMLCKLEFWLLFRIY